MKPFTFKGATTELFLPLNESHQISEDYIRRHVEFQISGGIRGLFVNGINAEPLYHSVDEQLTVAKIIVDAADRRVPVMGNIMVNSMADSLKLLRGYEAAGADSVCITQPSVYPYSQEALYQYFHRLLDETTLPVFIYNCPQSSNLLSPAFIGKLAEEHKNCVGYKDGAMNILHLQELIKLLPSEDFEIVAGSDSMIIPTLLMGGCGIVSFVSSVFPRLVVDTCDAFFAGQLEQAKQLADRVMDIRQILKSLPLIAGYKYAAELMGCPGGTVMPPLLELTSEQKDYLRREFENMGLL